MGTLGRYMIPQLLESRNMTNIVGVEIGVDLGWFSEFLLNSGHFKTLYSIDDWNHTKLDCIDENGEYLNWDAEINYNHTINLLSKFNESSVIIRKTSANAVLDFDDNSLDFVFLDANHTYDYVKKDLNNWYIKVKPGGMFCGHDYFNGTIVIPDGALTHLFGVKRAVDEFVEEKSLKLLLIEEYESDPSWLIFKPEII